MVVQSKTFPLKSRGIIDEIIHNDCVFVNFICKYQFINVLINLSCSVGNSHESSELQIVIVSTLNSAFLLIIFSLTLSSQTSPLQPSNAQKHRPLLKLVHQSWFHHDLSEIKVGRKFSDGDFFSWSEFKLRFEVELNREDIFTLKQATSKMKENGS